MGNHLRILWMFHRGEGGGLNRNCSNLVAWFPGPAMLRQGTRLDNSYVLGHFRKVILSSKWPSFYESSPCPRKLDWYPVDDCRRVMLNQRQVTTTVVLVLYNFFNIFHSLIRPFCLDRDMHLVHLGRFPNLIYINRGDPNVQ